MVDPMEMIENKNKHPYIIAVLSSDRKKAKYYIDVHKYLISVSANSVIPHCTRKRCFYFSTI